MAWTKTAADRQRDAEIYNAEYRQNKRILIRTYGRVCMDCGSTDRVQCDHTVQPSRRPGDPVDNSIRNLQLLCISCHGAKTARQSRAWGGKQPTDPPAQPTTAW